ncbi:hypothetical protein [Tunicatimonas pelagia]|uniref:hypothetical protein n=1 Tax=Tunicatimonas pelagia TaxID=931531 RepID=UPI002666B88E|nr:hypothetical protein [Tunicatimonas pelagia]WKN42568.1 hypothetical protein P0M28_26380 [Tunicatimonas pelagia]
MVSFDDSLIIDLANVYELVRAHEEWIQFTTTLDLSQKYQREALSIFLKTNYDLLDGHRRSAQITSNELEEFLKKYGELDDASKPDE